MDVVPPGKDAVIFTVLLSVCVPLQVCNSLADVQLVDNEGYSFGKPLTSATLTAIELIVVGAEVLHTGAPILQFGPLCGAGLVAILFTENTLP